MAGILAANNHHFAVTANNLAFVAHGFYGRSYFHDCSFFEFRNRKSEFGIGCRLIKFTSCSQFDCESYCRSVSYANKASEDVARECRTTYMTERVPKLNAVYDDVYIKIKTCCGK